MNVFYIRNLIYSVLNIFHLFLPLCKYLVLGCDYIQTILTKEAQKALIGWQLVCSKLITVKFWTSHQRINSNSIQCYAPTSEAIKWDFDQRLDGIPDMRKTEENHHLDGIYIYGCQSWGRQNQVLRCINSFTTTLFC
jgi:hypothetical protein